MTTSPPVAAAGWLVRLSGPPLKDIAIEPRDGGLTLGRHESCQIKLPADAEKVSRFHARLLHDEHGWQITDLGSSWGTFVNGCRIEPEQLVPLSEGDLIRITPWTFSFSQSH